MKLNCTYNRTTVASRVKEKAKTALLGCASQLASRGICLERLCRIACLVGNDSDIARDIAILAAMNQQTDGGWSDTEETIWCTKLLSLYEDEYKDHIYKAAAWLKSRQHEDGGWGLSKRDASRIPTTCFALTLLPDTANDKALSWVIQAWEKDLESEVKLTYKGGFALIALARHRDLVKTDALVSKTISYLSCEQNEDGGFGPWKGHPIGSDPWSTGITLVGLTAWPDLIARDTAEKALNWLCETQLDSGLWPYHFIDEGSSYAYWGLCNTIEYLEGTE